MQTNQYVAGQRYATGFLCMRSVCRVTWKDSLVWFYLILDSDKEKYPFSLPHFNWSLKTWTVDPLSSSFPILSTLLRRWGTLSLWHINKRRELPPVRETTEWTQRRIWENPGHYLLRSKCGICRDSCPYMLCIAIMSDFLVKILLKIIWKSSFQILCNGCTPLDKFI